MPSKINIKFIHLIKYSFVPDLAKIELQLILLSNTFLDFHGISLLLYKLTHWFRFVFLK